MAKTRFYVAGSEAERRMIGYEGPRWCCYWWFVGWTAISLGIHVSFRPMNFELHLPFGFIRVGEST